MKALPFVALSLFISIPAFAQIPMGLGKPEQLSRAGHPLKCRSEYINTSAANVRTSSGAANRTFDRELFIPYGSIVNVGCVAEATFCFVQAHDTTTSTSGYIEDSGSTRVNPVGPDTEGFGGCFGVLAGTYRDGVPFRAPFNNEEMVSQRNLSCTHTSDDTKAQIGRGRPCDADADCPGYTGMVCNDTHAVGGVYLTKEASVATQCWICIDQ